MKMTALKNEKVDGGNQKGEKCALCQRHRAVVAVTDGQGVAWWICQWCDRAMDWM